MAKIKKFGTFAGVFTPSILTILGVIMYLRLPMIVGTAGLWYTLGIILVAHIISASTGLSVSSIATDKKVEAGGTYYIISRSLGLPIGGTLGIALFVGLSFSTSLYLIGFSESLLSYFDLPTDINTIRITGSIALFAVTAITFISTSLAIKSQFFIMAAIALSLVSIFVGNDAHETTQTVFEPLSGEVSIMLLFGIFFPAVTGFEAGVSMSGDLENPKKSIPVGTIAAIVFGLVAYVLIASFFAFTVDAEELANNPNVLFDISWIPELVIAGIWGATISSALGSILGAPRILQATAIDKITWSWFGKGTGEANEPRNALILTFIIAELGILIGELDVIARIVSIFFITTYGFINLSCAFEKLTSADFRPQFKIPAWVSILGALACLVVMIQLDLTAMIGAVVILGGIYVYFRRKQMVLESGDSWSGVWSSLVKSGLQNLTQKQEHSRNWRPNSLVFSGSENQRKHLIELGTAISGRLGIMTAFELKEDGKPIRIPNDCEWKETTESGNGYFRYTVDCSRVYEGMDDLIRVYGFSGVRPNTVLMGWTADEDNKEDFRKLVETIYEQDMNGVWLNYNKSKGFGRKKFIDLWWRGKGKDLTFHFSLLRHLQSSPGWKDVKIRVLAISQTHDQDEKLYSLLKSTLEKFRLDYKIKIIDNSLENAPSPEIMERESKNVDLVIIGLDEDEIGKEEHFIKNHLLTKRLGTSIITLPSDKFETIAIDSLTIKKPQVHEEKNYLVELPRLLPTRYENINTDVALIDKHGLKELDVFFAKGIGEVHSVYVQYLERLEKQISSIREQLKKVTSTEADYRAQKNLIKIKNDFYFHSKEILERMTEEGLKTNCANVEDAVNWYLDKLKQDIDRTPQNITVTFKTEDVKINKDDSVGLKIYKRWLKFKRNLGVQSITRKVLFRKTVEFALYGQWQRYLSGWLSEVKRYEQNNLKNIRGYLISIDQSLQKLHLRIDKEKNEEIDIDGLLAPVHEQLQKTLEQEQKNYEKLQNRLRLLWRKMTQELAFSLSKLNVKPLISTLSKRKNVYANIEANNRNFSSAAYEELSWYIGALNLEVQLNSFKYRVRQEITEFIEELENDTEHYLIRPAKKLKEDIKDSIEDAGKDVELKLKFDGHSSLDLETRFAAVSETIANLFRQLPEESVVLKTGHLSQDTKYTGDPEPVTIEVRRISEFLIDSKLIVPAQQEVVLCEQQLIKYNNAFKDLVNHTNYQHDFILTNNKLSEDKEEKEVAVLQQSTRMIDQDITRLKEEIISTVNKINGDLEEALDPLSVFILSANTEDYNQFIVDYKNKQVRGKFAEWSEMIAQNAQEKLTRLLYSKSKGVILAKSIVANGKDFYTVSSVLSFVEKISPDRKVIGKLPVYYQNLFSGRSFVSGDFWVNRPEELSVAQQAYRRHQNGLSGGLVILGERNAGKTALARHIANKFFSHKHTYHLRPMADGNSSVKSFEKTLRDVTGLTGGADRIFQTMPHGSVLMICDLELWWTRKEGGMGVIDLITNAIDKYSEKIFFMINCNPYFYRLMINQREFNKYFLNELYCKPFDAEEIKQLLLLRHRSSGIKFTWKGKEEDEISEMRLASLFNAYFDYSNGVPGIALKSWLANINAATERKIEIQSPDKTGYKILYNITDEDLSYLQQFVLHKRLSVSRMSQIMFTDQESCLIKLDNLKRQGLVQEKNNKIFGVNSHVEHFIIQVLREKEFI
ncbi:APC family permease [Marinigracilibium pacificum]|uniref:Amino acid permease n=1 Tax=Marinigracilibium pacificum TaxID=2729599 RepID=A0A848J3B2_9BACT|nr:amino acid permease [Marinigracilibium pacificum]NMM49818.1 amino acid permease [Marinigracilibium pacificum]